MATLCLKLIALGDELGVILPAKLLARLRVQPDGTVLAKESPDGLTLLTDAAAHEIEMAEARRLMSERDAVLRILAQE